MIAAPAETTLTVSKIETESPTDTVIPKTEMTCEKAEVELPSNPNDSKSDEEDSFTAFSPLTKSGIITLIHTRFLLNCFRPLSISLSLSAFQI